MSSKEILDNSFTAEDAREISEYCEVPSIEHFIRKIDKAIKLAISRGYEAYEFSGSCIFSKSATSPQLAKIKQHYIDNGFKVEYNYHDFLWTTESFPTILIIWW